MADDPTGTSNPLRQKLMGLPVWGWLVVFTALGVVGVVWMEHRKKPADTSTDTTGQGASFDATDTGLATDQYETLLAQVRDLQGELSTPITGPPGPPGPVGPPGTLPKPPPPKPPGNEEPPPPKTPAVKYVTVTRWPSKDSTLSGIAADKYGNAALWPKIYQANIAGKKRADGTMGMIKNPNQLTAGWKLVLP